MARNTEVKTPYKRFLSVGMVEGISLIVLVFVAMPLKYLADMPEMVRVVGMIHGVLFIAYVVLLAYVTNFYGWKLKTALLSLLLSVLPFGTLWLKKVTRD